MKILLITILLFSTNALSSVTWSWGAVTKYTNGQSAVGEIDFYSVTCNGKPPNIIPHPETSYTSSPPIGSEITCSVTVTANNGEESGPAVFETWTVGDVPVILIPLTPITNPIEEN